MQICVHGRLFGVGGNAVTVRFEFRRRIKRLCPCAADFLVVHACDTRMTLGLVYHISATQEMGKFPFRKGDVSLQISCTNAFLFDSHSVFFGTKGKLR